MIWAIVDNEKIEANPNTKGICPICKGKVFSKCGEIIVWHWAHSNDKNCDKWYEPESIWHKHWKMTFGKQNSEIRMEKDGKYHIADILVNGNIVIELQNSIISKPTIRQRENFYGERMIWLINGEKFKESITEYTSLNRQPKGWLLRSLEIEEGKKEEFFKWKNPRKSWKDMQRPLFIDFGKESLLYVHKGMGTNQIIGNYISKEKFIKKYGGNFEYYCQQLF